MIDIIRENLAAYPAAEQENALKEILQEIALFALWRADFFDVALFQGGTSLRILHGLPRFSEDLDFLLRQPDPDFNWTPYLDRMTDVFREFGLKLETQSRERMDRAIRQAVLKDDSIARQLDLQFAATGSNRTIRIKLEIDTNPPALSGEATTFLDFPADFEVRHQDLPSNFALKIHAIEVLIRSIAFFDGLCGLQEPVRKRALSMVHVRNNAEVADVRYNRCVGRKGMKAAHERGRLPLAVART